MTIKTQIRIHKFGSFPDPQIQNLPGSTILESSWNHKSGILPEAKIQDFTYFVIQNSIGFYNLEWKKTLTETKIHKKNGCADPKAKKFT